MCGADELRQRGLELFEHHFGAAPEAAFFAPGRVNIIGEHIDYNGGLVMPCAIDLGILALVRYRSDDRVRCFSQQFAAQGVLSCTIAELGKQRDWRVALYGCLQQLSEWGTVPGFDLLLVANLPLGSGLSSSAALLVGLLKMFLKRKEIELDGIQLALAAQQVEHKFLGTQCGIMDQVAVANGRIDQALLLDCDTLEHRYLPFASSAWQLLIVNSCKPRKLADSEYNQRRQQCRQALQQINRHFQLAATTLCALPAAGGKDFLSCLKDEVLVKRTRHVLGEQRRTYQAAMALEKRDAQTLGRCLNSSHASLRDDYQVSCAELDLLVEWLQGQPQVLGARMTGAGFGGCALAIVAGELDCKPLGQFYDQQFGYQPEFYSCSAAEGVHQL